MSQTEQSHIERLQQLIALQYQDHPTGCGESFDEILCWEIHENGLTFIWLASKWGISLPTLGDLISDHCRGLEPAPHVLHAPYDPRLDDEGSGRKYK